MAAPAPPSPRHLRPADLRAFAQLATQATAGVTRIAEGVHQAVWDTLGVAGRAPGRTGGLTGLVYKGVHGVTRLVAGSLDAVLGRLEPLFDQADAAAPGSPRREAVLAALNGVMGDRLRAGNNPFATPMQLRLGDAVLDPQAPAVPRATGKLLLLIHGLCMNDLQWQAQAPGSDHAAALAAALGYTPVTLRYNTGLHISENGAELAALLEQLAAHWPVKLREIAILTHSMGGLVARSACHGAQQAQMQWPRKLKHLIFLGTPHHGAPLERAGNWVDALLGSTPYSAPFARLAQLRSAGITDLRYGLLLGQDWQGRDRFRRTPDTRTPLPLPAGVACYTVGATLAPKRGSAADRLLGDGLVPLKSALGQHADPRHGLGFAKDAQCIAYRTSHLDLLHSPLVTAQLLAWLAPRAR